VIVRVNSNTDRALAQSICGEEAKHFWEVLVYTAEAKPLLVTRACSAYVDGVPLHPDSLYFAEAVEVVIRGRTAFINTPFYRKSVSE